MSLAAQGVLQAVGTAAAPITFTAATPGASGEWGYLSDRRRQRSDSDPSQLSYVTFEGGGCGGNPRSTSSTAHPAIDHLTVRRSAAPASTSTATPAPAAGLQYPHRPEQRRPTASTSTTPLPAASPSPTPPSAAVAATASTATPRPRRQRRHGHRQRRRRQPASQHPAHRRQLHRQHPQRRRMGLRHDQRRPHLARLRRRLPPGRQRHRRRRRDPDHPAGRHGHHEPLHVPGRPRRVAGGRHGGRPHHVHVGHAGRLRRVGLRVDRRRQPLGQRPLPAQLRHLRGRRQQPTVDPLCGGQRASPGSSDCPALGGPGVYVYRYSSSQPLAFNTLTVQNSAGHGIYLNDATAAGVTLANATVSGSGGYGLYSDAAGLVVNGATVSANAVAASLHPNTLLSGVSFTANTRNELDGTAARSAPPHLAGLRRRLPPRRQRHRRRWRDPDHPAGRHGHHEPLHCPWPPTACSRLRHGGCPDHLHLGHAGRLRRVVLRSDRRRQPLRQRRLPAQLRHLRGRRQRPTVDALSR